MSFQIGLMGVLKECLIPIILMLIIVGIAWIGVAFAKDKIDRVDGITIRIGSLLMSFTWLLFFFIVAPSSSIGWTLQDNILHIEAYAGSGDLNLPTTKMALIEKTQSWLPVSYMGIHHFYTTVGMLKLHNGKTAGVLIYNSASPFLVLSSQNKYYVLSHPGITTLYDELKRRGVEDFKQ